MKDTNKDKLGANLVPLGHGRMQGNRRLVIPSILLENVGLEEGDPVDFFFDTGKVTGEKAIVIAKSRNPDKVKRRRHTKRTLEELSGLRTEIR